MIRLLLLSFIILALILRGLNPSTTTADVVRALKPRLLGHARLDAVKMAQDSKGRPRSVCFVQLPSVVDSMALHKSLVSEPIMIDNNQGELGKNP